MRTRWSPLFLFALREVTRRPGENLITGLALMTLTLSLCFPLLYREGLRQTSERVLAQGPSLVVRRVTAHGFAFVDVAEGLAALRDVRGVTRARARRWGVVRGPDGPLTLLGVDALARRDLLAAEVAAPEQGRVVVGTLLAELTPGTELTLGEGPEGVERTMTVMAALPEGSDVVGHDLVLVTWEDAGELLGMDGNQASDLVAWVFHDAEEQAIRADLSRALPWPVRITSRGEARREVLASLSREASWSATALLPALLGLVLLVVATGYSGRVKRGEVALLKALGWTTGDLLRWRLAAALSVGLPAVVLGASAAFLVVIWPGLPWLLPHAVGWSGIPPRLGLDGTGALSITASLAGLILVPWLGAVLWPLVRQVTTDPGEALA